MKKLVTIINCILLIKMSYCQISVDANSEKVLNYSLNDTTEFRIEFFKQGKLKSVERYLIRDAQKIKDGYQYEFYANQRLKKIINFNHGDTTTFLALYSETGETLKVIDFGNRNGLDWLFIDSGFVKSSIGPLPITSAHGSDDSSFLEMHLDLYALDIAALIEVSIIDPNFKTGIYLLRNDKFTYFIKNYYKNKKMGEGFIFNTRGKLKMISFTNFGNPETAYKVKSFKL